MQFILHKVKRGDRVIYARACRELTGGRYSGYICYKESGQHVRVQNKRREIYYGAKDILETIEIDTE